MLSDSCCERFSANRGLNRFTGPKITINLDDLSETQERAIEIEGIEVKHDFLPEAGTQNVPLAKEVTP